MDLLASQWETALIERILKVTQSPQSLPFYRRAIATLGEGIVDQEYGELRHRTRLGEVNNPAKYFNALLKKRLEAARNRLFLEELGCSGSPPTTDGRPSPQDHRSYQSSSGRELFMELAPIKGHEVGTATSNAMQLPYSAKTIPWGNLHRA